MTHHFHEFLVQEALQKGERLDRQLERWGWFRRHGASPADPSLLHRIGGALVRLGLWIQIAAAGSAPGGIESDGSHT